MNKICYPKVLEIIVIAKKWYVLLFFSHSKTVANTKQTLTVFTSVSLLPHLKIHHHHHHHHHHHIYIYIYIFQNFKIYIIVFMSIKSLIKQHWNIILRDTTSLTLVACTLKAAKKKTISIYSTRNF